MQDRELPKRSILQMPRTEADRLLQQQIAAGRELASVRVNTKQALEEARQSMNAWSDRNEELLRRIVDTDDLVDNYQIHHLLFFTGTSLSEDIDEFYQDLETYIQRLESVRNRLDLIPEGGLECVSRTTETPTTSLRVFVIHGHDRAALHGLVRVVEALGLEAVVLAEEANEGRTIIEKMEDASKVGYAVALLTADDTGARNGDSPRPRARQNVVFELGYFIGLLGRGRVCALYQKEVELPSDYSGVAWIDLTAENWPYKLGKELRQAGLPADLNRIPLI